MCFGAKKNRNSGVEVTESVTTAEVVDGATTTADLKLVGRSIKQNALNDGLGRWRIKVKG